MARPVPTIIPSDNSEDETSGARSLARPKSRILARLSEVMTTFSVFRSRWTMPLAWAAASPEAMSTPQRIACSTATGLDRTDRAREVPGTSSMTIQSHSSVSTMSKICTIAGWLSCATACASRRKRSLTAESAAR